MNLHSGGGGKRSTAKKKDRNKVGSIVPYSGRPLSAPPSFARHKRTRVTIIVHRTCCNKARDIDPRDPTRAGILPIGTLGEISTPFTICPPNARVRVSRLEHFSRPIFIFIFISSPILSPLTIPFNPLNGPMKL